MLVASLCGAASGYSAPARPALHSARASRGACMMSADPDKVLRRAEFWEPETCTLLELINVLGRWESSTEWATRTEFAVVDKARDENMAQGASVKRFEYAQRNSLGERVALNLNAPKLQFKDEKLAASVGKTVEEMNALPRPSKYACNVVYDALAQSKSGLIPPDVIMERRAGIVGDDGSLDLNALSYGINRARFTVILSWFLFGKGQIIGGLVVLKVLYDTTDISSRIPIPKEIQDILILGAVIFAAVFAAGSQASDDTEITDLLEAQELPGVAAEAPAAAEKEAAATPSA